MIQSQLALEVLVVLQPGLDILAVTLQPVDLGLDGVQALGDGTIVALRVVRKIELLGMTVGRIKTYLGVLGTEKGLNLLQLSLSAKGGRGKLHNRTQHTE